MKCSFGFVVFLMCALISDGGFLSLFLSLQMHHPIQMKPADSEKSNGEWHRTRAQSDPSRTHTHSHASIAFSNLLGNGHLCLIGSTKKHREERKRRGGGGAVLIYINIFFYV